MKQAFSYEDWAMGMMFGMAIGDAMGAPIEFQPSREPENYVCHYMAGGTHNVTKGEFTDDTSMTVAIQFMLLFVHMRKTILIHLLVRQIQCRLAMAD